MKPRVGLLVDRRTWAIGLRASSLTRYLNDTFDMRTFTKAEAASYGRSLPVDVLIALSLGLLPVPNVAACKVLVFIGSHTWGPTPRHVALIKDTAGLLCCSRELYAKWRGRHRRVVHVPWTVDTGSLWFPSMEPRQHVLPLVVGFAGTADRPEKGVNSILRPAVKLAQGLERQPKVVLKTCGTDTTFIPLDKMRENFYYKIDVLAVTSSQEGGPNPLLEAMACGVPVVTTRVGVVPEVLRNGGWIVDRSPKAFAERFIWFTRHPQELDKMGRAAQEEARERSWERHVELWRSVIHEACAA